MRMLILATVASIAATASVAAPTAELAASWNGRKWNGKIWNDKKWNGGNRAVPSKRQNMPIVRLCRIGTTLVVIDGRPVKKPIYGPCR